MSENAGASPIGGLDRIGEGVALLHQGLDELVGEVGVRTTVPSALREGTVLLAFAVDTLGREATNGLGQQVGEVRHLDVFGNLGLGLLGRVEDGVFAFDQGPLEGFLAAEDIEALAVLACRIERLRWIVP